MNGWIAICWWALATAGLTQVVTKSILFEGTRQRFDRFWTWFFEKTNKPVPKPTNELGAALDHLIDAFKGATSEMERVHRIQVKSWFYSRWIHCPMCFGAWAGAGLGWMMGVYPVIDLLGVGWVDTLLGLALAGFGGSAVSFLLVMVSRFFYLRVTEMEPDEDEDDDSECPF